MKLLLRTLCIVFLGITSAWANTPVGPMNYQGRLLDNSGIPVTGNYNFVVKIYNDPVSGTLKYQESHNGVAVDDGVYSFKVGTGTNVTGTWDIDLWQGNLNDLYLELVVSGETLSPRHELTSAPHAFTSTFALSADALGNKTAAEYDNILEGVCVASKGVWLEKADKCLGAGASFPGPTLTPLSDLTDKTDLTNLDLTDADVSGINFSANGVAWHTYLNGTLFKNTTYSVAGISGTDLRDTVWDSAIAADGAPVMLSGNTILIGATFKNMAMGNWDLSSISEYNMLSAAYLSSCPVGLPNDYQPWACRLMKTSASDYFLLGPRANFSTSSAASTQKFGYSLLDVDPDAFDNINLSHSSFVGSAINQNFKNSSLYQADLSRAYIRQARFEGTSFAGAKLAGATIENTLFDSSVFIPSLDLSNARLSYVRFLNTVSGANFTNTTLHEVDFTTVGASNFTSATLNGFRVSNQMYGNNPPYHNIFDKTVIYGDFHVAQLGFNLPSHMLFNDVQFYGAKWSGDFRQAAFTGATKFSETIFTDLNLCAASIPLADNTAPHDDLLRVKWAGPAECPDGTDVTGGSGSNTCNFGTRMTNPLVSVFDCTGLPQ